MTVRGGRVAAAVVIAEVMLAACASAPAPTKPATPEPFFAIRLAFADSAPGRQLARYGDTTVFLAPDAVMSDNDLRRVRPDTTPSGELWLRVHYDPVVSQHLLTVTGAHAGERLAVLLDSRIWNLVRIQSAIGRGDSVAIATTATGADAQRLAAQIRTKWPPR